MDTPFRIIASRLQGQVSIYWNPITAALKGHEPIAALSFERQPRKQARSLAEHWIDTWLEPLNILGKKTIRPSLVEDVTEILSND